MNASSSLIPSRAHRPFASTSALFALGLTALGLAGIYLAPSARGDDKTSTAAAPAAPKVTVAPVETRTLRDYREFLGRVEAVESVEIRPRVSGHIGRVLLQSGQLVTKGDVLFVIDPRWYQAQFDLATAQAQRAKVRVDIAEREAKRATELLQEQAVSAEEADTRNSRLAEARAELLAAQAALDTARLDLENTEVRSPITGRVSRAYVTAGNLVSGAPGGATLLTSVVSVGQAHVYADVDEATVLAFNHHNRGGSPVAVDMELGDETGFPRHGVVESTDNRLNPDTRTLTFRLVFPNEDGALVPGLSARVRLPVGPSQPALLVSERSIGTDQSQKFVLTVGADNTVAYRTVKLGPTVEGRRVILDGLKPGERVIINGLQHVRPGMVVTAETVPTTVAANL